MDVKLPLISVIVPVYNILDYLERCVKSITVQTYQNLEIILVDDGSNDGTEKLCDRLAQEDRRIVVYHKENGGSSSARNLGIARAAGEYLGFVDSDDYIDADMYEKLYDGILRCQVKIAQVGRDERDAAGKSLPDICVPPVEPLVMEAEDFLRELLLHKGDCSFCTKLISRDLFTELFPEGLLNEDFHLLVKMLPRAGKILSLPGHVYHVFYRIGSNSRKADPEAFSRVFFDSVANADLAEKIVKERYPALIETSFRFGVFQRIEYLLHIPISRMNRGNREYREIVSWLRKNWFPAMRNPVLTTKNKCYHTLFAIAPRTVRKLHKILILERKGKNTFSAG